MDTFLSSSCVSSPFSCQSFKCMLKHYTLLFPHYSRVLPVTRFPRFPRPPLPLSSNPGSYQSVTADTSHFLSEAHLLSSHKTWPGAANWPVLEAPQAPFPWGACPKAHRSWVSLHTLSPSQNTMIHSFSHQVHVIILKPQSLTSTAHMTLPPRSIITWKSTYIKIHFQCKRVLSSLFPSREKTTFQLQSHKCSVQLLTPLSTSTDMPHSPFALEFLWSVVQDV